MITIHASDAQPQFRLAHSSPSGSSPAVILWDDPTVAVVGTIGDLRRLLTRALRTLPTFIVGPEVES